MGTALLTLFQVTPSRGSPHSVTGCCTGVKTQPPHSTGDDLGALLPLATPVSLTLLQVLLLCENLHLRAYFRGT